MNRFRAFITSPWSFVALLIFMVISFKFFDPTIALYMHNDVPAIVSNLAQQVTVLGLGGIYLGEFLLLWLCGHFSKHQRMMEISRFLFCSTAVSGLFCDFLKVVMGRSRPIILFQAHDYGFFFWEPYVRFWSFPSGHSMFIASAMVGFALIWPKYRWFFVIPVLLVAGSRIILTAHFLSDAVVGVFLGALVSVVMYDIFIQQKWLGTTDNSTMLDINGV